MEECNKDKVYDEYFKKLDDSRIFYLKQNRNYKILTYVILSIVVLCFITVIVLVFAGKDKINQYYNLIPLGIGFVAVIVFMVLNKIKIKQGIIDAGIYYQEKYSCLLNELEYVCNDKVTDKTFTYNGSFSIDEFEDAMYFKDILKCTSRNLLEGKINDEDFTQIDCALGIKPLDNSLDKILLSTKPKKDDHQMIPCLYGRMYRYNYKLEKNERVILTFVAHSTYNPTNTKELHKYDNKEFKINDNITVYASSKELVNEVLTDELKDLVNSFKFNDNVQGGFICFNNNGLYLAFNIKETTLELPIKKEKDRNVLIDLINLNNFVTSFCSTVKK